MLKQRVITAVGLSAVLIVVLLLSGISWVLPLVGAFLAVMGVYELLCVTGAKLSKPAVYISLGGAVLIPLLPMPHYRILLAAVYIAAIVVFVYMMYARPKLQLKSAAAVTGIALMISFLFKSLAELRAAPDGFVYLIAAVLACMITDTAAFFVGRAWGKHKLAPNISPKKTVEGSIGGIVCCAFLLTAVAAAYAGIAGRQIDYTGLILWVLPATVIAQLGDLSMSVIKRIVGVKDFGKVLPGHGGILDRLDSYLFVIPFTLLYCWVQGGFIS